MRKDAVHPDFYLFLFVIWAVLALVDLAIGIIGWRPLTFFGIPGFVQAFSYQVPKQDPLNVFSRLGRKKQRSLVKGVRFRRLDETTLAFRETFALTGITYTPLFRGIATLDVVNRRVTIRAVFYWWILGFFMFLAAIQFDHGTSGNVSAREREFDIIFYAAFFAICLLIYFTQLIRFRRVGREIIQMIESRMD